ncbi:MAG: flagellar hook assembly protein FlgD [Planctomycetota bacterium]
MSQVQALGQNSQEITTNYLNLLVAQLQNQNPLEPMDNQDMAGQLAQLSSLEQTEQMNNNFKKVLDSTMLQEALDLTGKDITYLAETTDEDGKTIDVPRMATVGAVALEEDGPRAYLDNGEEISTDEIYSVGRDPANSALAQGAALIGKGVKYAVQSPDDADITLEKTGTISSVRLEQGEIRFVASNGLEQYEIKPTQIISIGL